VQPTSVRQGDELLTDATVNSTYWGSTLWTSPVTGRIDLTDPSFEPTDEQLVGLAKRAFAGVAEARAKTQARLRVEIAKASAESLAYLDRRAARDGA
jgi:hypothetical protein